MQSEIDYVSHLPSFYSSFLLNIYKHTSLSTAQLNLVCILVVNIAFGFTYSRIKGKLWRQLFGMIVGYLCMYLLYGIQGSVYLLLFILSMYPIIKLKDPNMTFWITQSILFITLSYFCWTYYPSYRIDTTTSLMGITVRLQMLTYNLYDADNLDDADNFHNKDIDEYKKRHACHHDITLFEYLAYMLFFVHALCGSNLTINDFMDISNNHWREWNKQYPPRPSLKDILKAFGEIILVSCIYGFGRLIFWYYPDLYSLSTGFTITRLIIISFSGFLGLFKYNIAWTICDFTALISGVSYSGVDNANGSVPCIQWNRAKNINSLKMLYPKKLPYIYKNWNMTIEHWLYYYTRFKTNDKYRMIKTRIIAAVFHGVYPGYYVFFIVSVPVGSIIKTLHAKLPNNDNAIIHRLWPVFVIFVCGFHFHWILNLNVWEVIDLMYSIYWFPITILPILYIVGKLV